MTNQTAVDYHLEDQVIVITGAAQGIGAACAQRFAQDGAAVALWDVNDNAARALAQTLTQRGQRATAIQCDVSRKADVDAALAATLGQFGRVDALINNAGIFKAANFLDITEADWDAVLNVNLRGAFLVAQAVARTMVQGGKGGAIVHMSSVNSVLAIPNIASYNVSKGGINQLTRVMAIALAEHGIRVNAVGPGPIRTDMLEESLTRMGAERAEAFIKSVPLGRMGETAEIAEAVAFLVSDAASYMTGQIVFVNGGGPGG